mgnify:CR=1 FL=1|jgi:hypothetical protein
MAYIGRTPTPAALTASDITDGIISTAKIADNAVTEPKTAWNDVPYRNIIINGDMSQSQRATSTSSVATNGYHACDRFRLAKGDSTAVVTISQATDVPTGEGFFNSFKVDVTTEDASFVAADNILIQQKMEGQMLQHLKKGTANAESLTLSFWVKSTKTGTYIASLYDRDNSRLISKSYTVSVSDTWEEKSVTFAGDTTGALGNDNGASLDVWWWLGAGSNYTSGTLATSWESSTSANHAVGQVNSLDSTSNDFLITGIQLEVGTSASDFEFLPYDVNLQRCFRYFEHIAANNTFIGMGGSYLADYVGLHRYCTPKRGTPSITQVSGTDYFRIYTGTSVSFDSFTIAYASQHGCLLYAQPTMTDNLVGWFTCNNASAKIALEAEL